MRIAIIGKAAKPVLLSLLVAAALVAATVLATMARSGWGTEQAAAQDSTSITASLDMDTSDGPCTDIDGSTSHNTGDSYVVAICVTDLYQGQPIAVASFKVLYDDTLNIAPEVADADLGLDDNPDANAGTTTWGDGLGGGFDCSGTGLAYPAGDKDAATGPGHGQAYISCRSSLGPWTLGDNETSGVIAVISFTAIAAGNDALTISQGLLGYQDATEMATCNPEVGYSMTCDGASEGNQGASIAVPTSAPGPAETPPALLPPTEILPPAAPPVGGAVPVIAPPPTGSGPAAGSSPWTTVGWLLAGAAGAAIATGGLLRLARGRQR